MSPEVQLRLIADAHGGRVETTVDRSKEGRWLHVTHLRLEMLPADFSAMARELSNVLLDMDCTLVIHSTHSGKRDLTAVYGRPATTAEVEEELARRDQMAVPVEDEGRRHERGITV